MQTHSLISGGLVASFLLIGLSGCGANRDERRLLGKWQMEGAEELADRMFDDASIAERQSLQLPTGGMHIELEFGKKGELTTRTAVFGTQTVKQGTWEVVSAERDRMVIRTSMEAEESTELTVEFLREDTIKLVPPNMAVLDRAYHFKRID